MGRFIWSQNQNRFQAYSADIDEHLTFSDKISSLSLSPTILLSVNSAVSVSFLVNAKSQRRLHSRYIVSEIDSMLYVCCQYVNSRNCLMEFRFAATQLQLPLIIAAVGTGNSWEKTEVSVVMLYL